MALPRRTQWLVLALLLAILAAALQWQWPAVRVIARLPEPPPNLPRIAVKLEKIADGFDQITDLQPFPPPCVQCVAVLQKGGQAFRLDLASGNRIAFFETEVATASEEGLLGLAFEPSPTAETARFYTNSVVTEGGQDKTTIDAWQITDISPLTTRKLWRVLAFSQPYANHNAGQLAFGPDGMLYIGTGDGGSGGDPHKNGQNPNSFLGKMLRIDVRGGSAERPYRVPPDNPFVGNPAYLPEIWAIGLRNPWRYSFDTAGRLWVADVGQNEWEEIDLASRGDNLGWNVREGRHCFLPAEGCPSAGFREPYWEGKHPPHVAIIGGKSYSGRAIPALAGKYVFGDFGPGRLWALDPPDGSGRAPQQYWLADHRLTVTTFGQTWDGEILVGDFAGVIAKLVPER